MGAIPITGRFIPANPQPRLDPEVISQAIEDARQALHGMKTEIHFPVAVVCFYAEALLAMANGRESWRT